MCFGPVPPKPNFCKDCVHLQVKPGQSGEYGSSDEYICTSEATTHVNYITGERGHRSCLAVRGSNPECSHFSSKPDSREWSRRVLRIASKWAFDKPKGGSPLDF